MPPAAMLTHQNVLPVDGRELQHVLIDLDDTLYRCEEIPSTVRNNIQDYMVAKLGVSRGEVEQLTAQLYYNHGTTMAGLASRGFQLDYDDWHAHVHATLDYDRLLGPQPATHRVLEELTLQRHVFTNADAKHAAACLTRMGLADCFQSIWCFENVMDLAGRRGLLTPAQPVLCKPNKLSFELVLDQIGATPATTMFVDDSMRNVAAAHELGIFSVLVSPQLAAQVQHHVPGADLVVASFEALRDALPQVFAEEEPREEVPAGVPVSVMAS